MIAASHPKSTVMETLFSRKALSIAITCFTGWSCALLAINIFRDYVFGLFVWLPFVMGAISTMIYAYKNTVPRKKLVWNAQVTLLIFCAGLFTFAWEGIICIIMAAPVGMLFTWLGARAGYALTKKKVNGNTLAAMVALILSVPLFMAFEHSVKQEDEIRYVTTSIEINAPAEKVWKHVVVFPQLKEPSEFVFKTGIAYPINATIDGNGVGAVRHCNFSTGSFTEPITIWDEPRLLRFSVADQPETMKELSFYDIHPNHLHGFWSSKQGQFKLTSLPNGHTLLEGTTWYVNKIKPGIYWAVWSDYIVHKIHLRVLKHIKMLAEL